MISFRPALAGCFAGILLCSLAGAQHESSSQASESLATFAGQAIYEDQLSEGAKLQLQRMMEQVYAVKRRALQSVLNQKLVEAEAQKRGMSAEELLKTEVDSKIGDPADEEVSAAFRSRQDLKNLTLEDVREPLRQQLKSEAIQKARLSYMQGLMQRAVEDREVVLLLRPGKVEVPTDPARLKGDPKAPVTIVEFSDFSCPSCRQAEAILKELLDRYPGRVRLGFRDFPLAQIHPQAELAAEASRCAAEQGKFWEYHDLLFANPDRQGRGDLIAHARTLKLDENRFNGCLSSGRYKPQILRDIDMAIASGVSGAPGFVINGSFLEGAQPAEVFEKIIDQELAAAAKPAQ